MNHLEAKRVRQACRNCRRKKTRCSGQRPCCSFCARLRQKCSYDKVLSTFMETGDSEPQPTQGHVLTTCSGAEAALVMESSLSDRLAILESKMGMLPNRTNGTLAQDKLVAPPYQWSFSPSFLDPDQTSRFIVIPPSPVVESLVDTYFRYCHCQPYAYFRQQKFRERLFDNALPKWLILAFIATASRFSDDDFFQGQQEEAANSFADAAWSEIHENVFSEDSFLNHHVVQALSMLAVLDFTAGRNKRGWMKIGLAIQFAQALNLSVEPDPTLPDWLQDEHRGTFWSIYLLDRFVSCGAQRIPTIQDNDCTVKLGLDPVYCDVASGPAPVTLENVLSTPRSAAELGQAGHSCVLASALGRIQKYCLRPTAQARTYPLWDPRSEFASIHATLKTFEAYSPLLGGQLDESISQLGLSRGNQGFMCFSHALYFTNRCLLLHPFLLHQDILMWRDPVPLSFLRHSLLECHESATTFVDLLQHLLKARLCLTSFIGYCAVTAGVIHRLFQRHHDSFIQASSFHSYEKILQFLQDAPVHGRHFSRMRQALADFEPDPEATAALVDPSLLAGMDPHPDTIKMWSLLDYGWLSDQARDNATPDSQLVPPKHMDMCDWMSIIEPIDIAQTLSGLNQHVGVDMAGLLNTIPS
ncbi:hypothetical protein LCI18_007040 [Fusarium solani-melongenae]|uniref:Uncharacterized protein n=1 Tax=Fusarium solani subsp. cucurbitae TaxID=2747967 RepID=A0ACD3Z4H1_FUSSC|nr:hypothetical protein LCI18_007040 [Fusarium solani-melongenae]